MKGTAVVVVLLLIGIISAGNIITSPPVDSASCYGGIATFHCGSDRGSDVGIIQWLVDGEAVAELDNDIRGLSSHTSITDDYAASNLTIVGLPVNNGVVIGCIMVTKSFATDSEAATFTVTAIPPITSLSIEFTGAIMNITWNAPSVLPVDYHYLINISYGNVSTSNTTVDSVYTVSISSCSINYTVSVSVVDIGYTHLHSVPLERTEQSSSVSGDLYFHLHSHENADVKFADKSTCYLHVSFQASSLCPGQSLEFTESVESIRPADIALPPRIVTITSSSGDLSLGPYDKRFIGYLTVTSNTINTTGFPIRLSTFNVQDFSLTVLPDDTVQLACFFALNSFADGCNVTYNSTQSVIGAIFITKDGNETEVVVNYTGIPEGIYTFSIYDVVDGVSNMSVAAVSGSEYRIMYRPKPTTTTATGPSIIHTFSQVTASLLPSLVIPSVTLSVATTNSYNTTVHHISSNGYVLASVFTVVGIVLVSVITTIVTGLVVYIIRRNRKNSQVNVYTQNPAYERVFTTNRRPEMTSNIAYETVIVTR